MIALATPFAIAQQDHRKWTNYGGGADSSHYVTLNQINKSNVNQLQIAWIYPTGDDNTYLFNPVVVDNVMYVLAKNSSLVALDASTGKEIWIHSSLPGLSTRGIAYWESKDRKDRRLIFAINGFLEEIDARTGKSIDTLTADLKVFPQVILNVKVREKKPLDTIPTVVAAIHAAEQELKDTGRVVIRYSGTEALARVMIEAESEPIMHRHSEAIALAIRTELGA